MTQQICFCFRCGKAVRGKAVWHIPPVLDVQLGIDFAKTFHPKCYEAEEREAAAELNGEESTSCGTK